MKIAIVAPLSFRVPPDKYGGSEIVVSNLTEELVRRGHAVDLYASGDSITSARLNPASPHGLWQTDQFKDIHSYVISMIYDVAKHSANYDIIHEHLGPYGTVLARLCGKPVVSTVHAPITKPRADVYEKVRDNFHLVSISDSQRRDFPGLNYAATVYNGIPVTDFDCSLAPGEYLCFLGRFDQIKGIREAIGLARATNNKLLMAAPVKDQDFFHRYVEPEIDNKQIFYIGEVGFEDKVKLLKGAKALISLVNWEEPFGLVVPEANSCGTPVIVTPRGAFMEIVTSGINGFITDGTMESAIEAVEKIADIRRSDCRTFAEEHFSISRMADGYESVYRNLMSKK